MSAVSVLTALILLTANYGQSNADFIKGDTRGSWIEGEEWCNNNGRHLASIHSDAENALANDACLGAPQNGYACCWIGAHGSGDGDWSWGDGSVWKSQYTQWKGTAGDEDCGYIMYTDWYGYTSSGCNVIDFYPVCGHEVSTAGCDPELSGFEWDYNGVWTPVDGEFRGGAPVYSRVTYGSTNYLWKLTDPYGWGNLWGYGQWDVWVTGYALDGSRGYWSWRWGGNLWDCSDNPYNACQRWRYWTGSQWLYDYDATVTCSSASTDNSASMMSGSGVVWNGTMLDGAHTFPMLDEPSAAATAASTTSLIGAAIGVVAVVAMAVTIVSVAKRRKRARAEEETQIAVELGMGKAAVNSVESVTAEMPSKNETVAAATDGDVAAEVVVEAVAPKVDDAVSVQQEE